MTTLKVWNGTAWETVTSGGGGGHTIEDETTALTQRAKLAFQGPGVIASDDAANDRTVVSIGTGLGTPPYAIVGLSADFPIPSGTGPDIVWNVEKADPFGFHDNAVNPTRLTVPAGMGGTYLVQCTGAVTSNATGLRNPGLYKNGAAITPGQNQAATSGVWNFDLTTVVDLVPGDYITVNFYQTSGATLQLFGPAQGSTTFSLTRLSTGVSGSGGPDTSLISAVTVNDVLEHTFTGLNGDLDEVYEIILDGEFRGNGSNRAMTIRPNGQTSGTRTVGQNTNIVGAAAQAVGSDIIAAKDAGIGIGKTWDPSVWAGHSVRGFFFARSGKPRRFTGLMTYGPAAAPVDNLFEYHIGGVWDNTATNVTSLQIHFGGGNFRGRIYLKRSTPAGGASPVEVVTTLPTTDLLHGRTIRYKAGAGIYWDLMYDTSIGDTSKWVAVAKGNKLSNANVATIQKTMASQYVAEDYGTTNGPTLVVPEDGYYELTQAADIWVAPNASGVWEYLLYITRADNTQLSAIGCTEWATGASSLLGGPTSLNRTEPAGGVASPVKLTKGETLKWRHEGSHNVANAMRSRSRAIHLVPIRLG